MMSPVRSRGSAVALVVAAAVSLTGPASGQPGFPETADILQQAYTGELEAQQRYSAYAVRARKDGYPHIAHLFEALSQSESIHARNFVKAARDRGLEIKDPGLPAVADSGTKANVKKVIAVETLEIDQRYPDFIERLKKEGDPEAISHLMHAWIGERQHKGLLKRIQSYMDKFFPMVARRIEAAANRYFVCQDCGSTVLERPTKPCPVCGKTPPDYREVPFSG